ncbi:MAG: DUF502 domain-containing protein [Candidatus Edwardsbacteria bacterium]|jgi:uncharacterized membrane protein|nr:DUF502 domain-containing protein [Candidatus Edwardsbacteria bacterium]
MSPWKTNEKLKQRVQRHFFTGFVVLLPVVLTAYVCWLLFTWSGRLLGQLMKYLPYLQRLPYQAHLALGFLLLMVFVYLVGFFASHLFGRRLLKLWEQALVHIPFVKIVYLTTKKFTDTFFTSKYAFRQVVAVEYPRPGSYALGFLTSERTWTVGRGRIAHTVYLPNTPNPTGGRIMVVPPDRLYIVDMTVEEAIQLIVSGGMVVPPRLSISRPLSSHDRTARTPAPRRRSRA